MITVNMHEAKLNFSQLMTQIANGQEIIITRSGQEFARISPIKQHNRKRLAGQDKDNAWIADSFNEGIPEDLEKLLVS